MYRWDRELYWEYFRLNPFWTARWFSIYQPNKMKQTFKECNPSICNKDLMSNDNVFMTRDVIKEQCDCIHKNTCMRIIDLLSQHKKEGAFILLDDIKWKDDTEKPKTKKK